MDLKANENKQLERRVGKDTYLRYAIPTHYVQIGEDYLELIRKYVLPHYQEGDMVSISEKVIALCQRRVIYKKDMQVSFLAKFLSKFAVHSSAGIGVDSPYKMQFAINICGPIKVIYAAICAGIGKLFHKKGVFYDIVGMEVTGLDGFYDKFFPEYGEFGIRIPENPNGVCDEIYEKLGVKSMIVDANDLECVILGKADVIDKEDAFLEQLIEDNPAGQSNQLTPFILIRKLEKV